MLKRKVRFVWCAEDEKYGLQAIYFTRKAAEKDWYLVGGKHRWPSGYGGSIIKRKVNG